MQEVQVEYQEPQFSVRAVQDALYIPCLSGTVSAPQGKLWGRLMAGVHRGSWLCPGERLDMLQRQGYKLAWSRFHPAAAMPRKLSCSTAAHKTCNPAILALGAPCRCKVQSSGAAHT